MSIATSIVWHKDRWVSPTMRAFIDVVVAKLQPAKTPMLMRELAS
jgi:hypothetical protein